MIRLDRYKKLLDFEKMNENIYKITESGKGLRISLVNWTNGKIIKELKYR